METKTIKDFLSERRTTEKARFNFPVPDTVESDLAACYTHIVEQFGCRYVHAPDTDRVLRSAARWLREGKPGLLLTGGVGTGKSKLLQAIQGLITYYTYDHYIKDGRQKLKILSAQEICDLASSSEDKDVATFSSLKACLYLGIDDLGVEPVTVKRYGTEFSPVIDTLYARYERRATTIFTTNFDLDTIRDKYGARILDRLVEQYDRITFNFKSFRQ
jgi:DNA replication protein DnaC